MTPGQLHALLDMHRVAVGGESVKPQAQQGTPADLAMFSRMAGAV